LNKDYLYFMNRIQGADVSPSAVLVYRTLLDYANRTTWSCFPSINTIAKKTKLNRRTVIRQINLLEREGLILKIPRQRENNGNTSNMYFFN